MTSFLELHLLTEKLTALFIHILIKTKQNINSKYWKKLTLIRCWIDFSISIWKRREFLITGAPYSSINWLIKFITSYQQLSSLIGSVSPGLFVSRLVGLSVFYNSLKWPEVTLPCSYRSTCFCHRLSRWRGLILVLTLWIIRG